MKNLLDRAVFFLVLTLISVSLSLSLTSQSYAAGDEKPTPTPTPKEELEEQTKGGVPVYGGEPVYGGGVISPREGDILLEKMVKNPASGIFVDHLGPTDPRYRPLQIITFQVRVQNPGEETLENIAVVDSLPDFLDFMSGPGTYDADNRQLSWTVKNLDGGNSELFEIKARVSHESILPEDKEVICPVNVVEANAPDRSDRDESQFCIEKKIEIPQVPSAGPSLWLITSLSITSSLIGGLIIRRISYKG
ncbi:hypothetical protein A3D78_05695 [Candidatus Gottesmanbacteria bacterium RIFCSPHIGHO2_02_FULL_39_14]|uniref:DUF11 domain-containing protein n=1 Tax=Candidatus Gottesmanbacteria bacterium RIFCSPHIGHO2_02_FULL_39_14 TaxID=1798383 RepID=A0A1F6A2M2_9BACT|nr:MAG: hypothetical protein A3D78_05695 [Candidatus Gottesmanbacteria bacterium RIFCSPHIGHO2_02_FULL_39_14]